jgi:hypothetical protein
MPAFSVFFLIWTCDEIVIPSTPVDFRAFAEYPGRPASLSVRGFAAANSAAHQPGVGEIAPEFLALAGRPKSARANWWPSLGATWAETYVLNLGDWRT